LGPGCAGNRVLLLLAVDEGRVAHFMIQSASRTALLEIAAKAENSHKSLPVS
jgi:hypothetical protein